MIRAAAGKLLGRILRLFVFLYYRFFAERLSSLQREYFTSQVRKTAAACGDCVRINGSIRITDPTMFIIGSNVHIGKGAYFHTAGGLTIGDNCHVSRNVTIYTAQHRYEGTALPYDDEYSYSPVAIGKNVWIGMNASILPGVSIGDGAIVGMGAIVSRNVGDREIVGNPPLRVLKNREPQRYERLEREGAYGGINGRPLSRDHLSLSRETLLQKGANAFFVVGTGRCGTTSIAWVLRQHSQITCLHEPNH
jgi:acetyltransferase-like isoleucine patch superfamily enzyme